jgi:hypothetical protein
MRALFDFAVFNWRSFIHSGVIRSAHHWLAVPFNTTSISVGTLYLVLFYLAGSALRAFLWPMAFYHERKTFQTQRKDSPQMRC